MNEEFLVSAVHYTVLIASLPFVHTARRFNRLGDPANYEELSMRGNCCEPYHLEDEEVVTRYP